MVVSPKYLPPLPPRKYSCYSFLIDAEVGRIVAMTNSIEPATFGLVAQCLNQLQHRVPTLFNGVFRKSVFILRMFLYPNFIRNMLTTFKILINDIICGHMTASVV